MIRVAISVEGPTEEEFSKGVLATHLRSHGIEAQPILLGRARGRSPGDDPFKGSIRRLLEHHPNRAAQVLNRLHSPLTTHRCSVSATPPPPPMAFT